jgi:hypothetical protein
MSSATLSDMKVGWKTVFFTPTDLDTFPQMVRLESDSAAPERRSVARRNTEYMHDTEIIFILPSLQMHLKTEHMQGENEPKDSGMPSDCGICVGDGPDQSCLNLPLKFCCQTQDIKLHE